MSTISPNQRRLRHRRHPLSPPTAPSTPPASIAWWTSTSRSGVDGLTILGIMGEAPKLTQTEAIDVTRRVARPRRRPPRHRRRLRPRLRRHGRAPAAVMDLGAAGVMVAPPGSLRTDDQIVAYYRQWCETIGPDVPWSCRTTPSPPASRSPPHGPRRISRGPPEHRHAQARGLARASPRSPSCAPPSGRRPPALSILCGNGGLFLPEELRRGADGAMTGFAFPEMMVEVCRLTAAGDHRRAPRTSSTPICLWSATSSSPASASPCASTCSRSAARSPRPRSAGPAQAFLARQRRKSSSSARGRSAD